MVVYADVLILLNFYVDYLLLLATEALCRSRLKFVRRLLASLISALFSLFILLPEKGIAFSVMIKLLCAAVTVLSAFGFQTLRMYLRRMLTFFAVSYAFAGVMIALSLSFSVQGIAVQNSMVYYDISPLFLLCSTTLFYLMIRLYAHLTKRGGGGERYLTVTLICGSVTVTTKALLDTGNSLTDSISGAPVMVADRTLAERLLGKEKATALSSLSAGCCDIRGFRLIPYHTVGGEGVLPAFKPDRVILTEDKRPYQYREVYLAVSPTPLKDGVEAIVGPDFIDCKGEAECCSIG